MLGERDRRSVRLLFPLRRLLWERESLRSGERLFYSYLAWEDTRSPDLNPYHDCHFSSHSCKACFAV